MRRVAHAARIFRLSLKRKPAKKFSLFVVADFFVLAKKNLCRRLHVRLFFCSGRAADVRCQPRADVRNMFRLCFGALFGAGSGSLFQPCLPSCAPLPMPAISRAFSTHPLPFLSRMR